MKKQLIFGIALAALVAGADLCQAAGLTFTKVMPAKTTNIIDWGEDLRQNLKEAMNVHNLMMEIRGLKHRARQLNVTTQMRELEEQRLSALEKCSVDKLGEQFKNPQEVWDKMKAEYAKREKELTLSVDSAEPTPEEEQDFLNYMQKGELSAEMIGERYASWRIGQEILTDVYQNQDAWGERKDAKGPSFPLWEDQKYVFDKEWNDYYVKLNAFFGVPPEGRPLIGDEKYDYAKYEDVQKAHAAYVAVLAAKSPVKAAALAANLKKPPEAPKPLPPKNEVMVYFETETPEANVYPALPEPWKKYAENGFKDVNPKGEMAADFKKGLVLKEQAKNERQNNRLTAYAHQKENVDGIKSVEDLSLYGGDRALGKAYAKLEKYMELTPQEDLLDEKVREKVLEKLKAKKDELVARAEKDLTARPEDKEEMVPTMSMEDMDDLPELKKLDPKVLKRLVRNTSMSVYERDENIIKALKKDKEGRVYINEVNAGDIDQMMEDEAKRRAYIEGEDTLEKMLAAAAEVKIDETCLNGGI